MKTARWIVAGALLCSFVNDRGAAEEAAAKKKLKPFAPADVFQLEFAAEPQISPHGASMVYLRKSIDVMTDRVRSQLSAIDISKGEHFPLTDWDVNASAPRWSPDGERIAYAAKGDKVTQIFVLGVGGRRFMFRTKVTNVTEAPREFVWSPDGKWLAFSMLVHDKRKPYAELPEKPEGAEWAKSFKVYDSLVYRDDGEGYVKEGYYQLFVVPADGGSPRQITDGKYQHHDTPAWTADGKALIFSANRRDDWEHEPLDSELYRVDVASGEITQLTDRRGVDASPTVSTDGKWIAYIGFDDVGRSHHQMDLYVMTVDGKDRRCLTEKLDRDVSAPRFAHNGGGVYFQYDDEGNTKVGYQSLASDDVETIAENVGGVNYGRPYSSGSYSVSNDGVVAFTHCTAERPADVAIIKNLESDRNCSRT